MSPKDDAGRLQRWVDGQPSGSLDGVAFKDVAGLGKALHDHPSLPVCLVNRAYSYGTGGPISIASCANRTWRDVRSASENTATVSIPSSWHARMIRTAISPRFAINILEKGFGGRA